MLLTLVPSRIQVALLRSYLFVLLNKCATWATEACTAVSAGVSVYSLDVPYLSTIVPDKPVPPLVFLFMFNEYGTYGMQHPIDCRAQNITQSLLQLFGSDLSSRRLVLP